MAFRPGPKLKAALLFAAVAICMIVLGWLMSPVLVPLLLASILYVMLEPMVSWLQRKGMARMVAIVLVLLGTLAAVGAVAAAVTPVLMEQVGHLRGKLPGAWNELSGRIVDVERSLSAAVGMESDHSLFLERVGGITRSLPEQTVKFLGMAIPLLALWVVTVPLVAFFLLKDYRSLRNLIIGLTPNRNFEVVLSIYHRVAERLQSYFRGVMVQSGVMAVITTVGFLMIGLPMAPVLGVLAGILNIIPYLGPVLGLVAPIVVAMTTGAGVDAYVGIAVVVMVAQLVDNIFVIPTVVARAANLHPLVALFGVIIAGSLFGLPGMIFAIPVLSSSRIIYRGLLKGIHRAPA